MAKDWKALRQAAVREKTPSKIIPLCDEARDAISNELIDLMIDGTSETERRRDSLEEALRQLTLLHEHALKEKKAAAVEGAISEGRAGSSRRPSAKVRAQARPTTSSGGDSTTVAESPRVAQRNRLIAIDNPVSRPHWTPPHKTDSIEFRWPPPTDGTKDKGRRKASPAGPVGA